MLGLTSEHPLFIKGSGWIEARNIVIGTKLVAQDGSDVTVTAVVRASEHTRVYNISVGQDHTYLIGAHGVWSHNDTYIANRGFGVNGQAKCRCDPGTHTFVFTTSADGGVNHTYSWGNTANVSGWNLDAPEDIAAAKAALQLGFAEAFAGSYLDPFVEKAFSRLNKKSNEHLNGFILYNCKYEAGNLLSLADELHTNSLFQK